MIQIQASKQLHQPQATPALRILLISLTLLSVALLSACNGETREPITIGILLFSDTRQPQVDGFIAEMDRLGYDKKDSVRYILVNAKKDRSKLDSLVAELNDHSPALLVAAGGLEADSLKRGNGPQSAPVVVLYVNAIVERGLVNSRSDNGWNVTGVDNLNAELSGKRVELLHDALPDSRRILVMYYEKIAPSRIGALQALEVGNKLGLDVDLRAVNSRDQIKSLMASIQPGEYDAMLTVPNAPIDSALHDVILPRTKALGIPVFTHAKAFIEFGAFASYGASLESLGQQAARLADKVLKGAVAKHIPFETPKQISYTLNEDVQLSLGIELSSVTEFQVNHRVTTRN